jgi:hypothetical protein
MSPELSNISFHTALTLDLYEVILQGEYTIHYVILQGTLRHFKNNPSWLVISGSYKSTGFQIL